MADLLTLERVKQLTGYSKGWRSLHAYLLARGVPVVEMQANRPDGMKRYRVTMEAVRKFAPEICGGHETVEARKIARAVEGMRGQMRQIALDVIEERVSPQIEAINKRIYGR